MDTKKMEEWKNEVKKIKSRCAELKEIIRERTGIIKENLEKFISKVLSDLKKGLDERPIPYYNYTVSKNDVDLLLSGLEKFDTIFYTAIDTIYTEIFGMVEKTLSEIGLTIRLNDKRSGPGKLDNASVSLE